MTMPRNTNPWLLDLLAWHGHERGGVRVPFQDELGKPLGVTVDTPLIRRLRGLARSLTAEQAGTPRWLFLVGGPGNGKSEAVEAFIEQLDAETQADGQLKSLVTKKFRPDPVTPRRVIVEPHELQQSNHSLQRTIRRLILIQDASAVDSPDGDAEDLLIKDLADLFTSPSGQEPIFICCANRGLLARALSKIRSTPEHQWLNVPSVTELLSHLLMATGLGPEALRTDRPGCWPLDSDRRFAAWPLDLDSLISSGDGQSPFERMLDSATNLNQWDCEGRCSDCSSKPLCPFYTNTTSLRQEDPRGNLLKLLRHGEFAVGQRWNFRDAFSLCAELLVGQRQDFKGVDGQIHPCEWVHERVDEITLGVQLPDKVKAIWGLTIHLYQQALFPTWPDPEGGLDTNRVARSPLTLAVIQMFRERRRLEGTQVRSYLSDAFSVKLDPAYATPTTQGSLLHLAEDEFGQSIQQGLNSLGSRLSIVEQKLLALVTAAEQCWSETVRESVRVQAIVKTLRSLATILVKRSLGVTHGEYLNLEHLNGYEALFRGSSKLTALVQPLRRLLAPDAGGMFRGSLVRVFGQPLPDGSRDIVVESQLGLVLPRPAPQSSDERPGHDIPWVEVEEDSIPIPLTFDLYVALTLSTAGCDSASFPPHTRAAIDKVRNAIAARLSRDREGMMGGMVAVRVGGMGRLYVNGDGNIELQAEG